MTSVDRGKATMCSGTSKVKPPRRRTFIAAPPPATAPVDVIRPPYVGKLNCLTDLQKELGRLYRAARRGTLPSSEAARLTYILDAAVRVTRAVEEINEIRQLKLKLDAIQSAPTTPMALPSWADPIVDATGPGETS